MTPDLRKTIKIYENPSKASQPAASQPARRKGFYRGSSSPLRVPSGPGTLWHQIHENPWNHVNPRKQCWERTMGPTWEKTMKTLIGITVSTGAAVPFVGCSPVRKFYDTWCTIIVPSPRVSSFKPISHANRINDSKSAFSVSPLLKCCRRAATQGAAYLNCKPAPGPLHPLLLRHQHHKPKNVFPYHQCRGVR